MYTVQVSLYSPLTQEFYDHALQKVCIRKLTCSCGVINSLIYHGAYCRHVITEEGEVKLSVTRVKCTTCGKTHAILLSTIVPYARLSMLVQLKAIRGIVSMKETEHILQKNVLLEKSTLTAAITRYQRMWKERVKKLAIESGGMYYLIWENRCSEAVLAEFFAVIEKASFQENGQQLMQIRKMPNSLIIQKVDES